MQNENILVWLPSPLGDAVLSTPALGALRESFKSAQITFFANDTVRQVLSPTNLADQWLLQESSCPFAIAKTLKKYDFTQAILFKNSLGSALSVFLAKIPSRTGYVRDGRGIFLTEKLFPEKLANGKFKPVSMIDYYLTITSWLGAETDNQKLELHVGPESYAGLKKKLPHLIGASQPVVIFVPGGAFGLSKCWAVEKFAQTADWLIKKYNSMVVVSVSPHEQEKQIAREICDLSKNELINLGEQNLAIDELKALFSIADLVICNDTGPRHIAIAFERKIITMFGPNERAWTQTGYENEIQIVGDAPCAPCLKPVCKKNNHQCMKSISIEQVCEAAKSFLENITDRSFLYASQEFVESAESFFVDKRFSKTFQKIGLASVDSVFSYNAGENLTKENLGKYRGRFKFEVARPSRTLFLKKYDSPPALVQIRNFWTSSKRISSAFSELETIKKLTLESINTPKVISYGQQLAGVFEKRSFIITEKIPNAESLEKKLPGCFYEQTNTETLRHRRNFIAHLAGFVRKFHNTGFRHRDLYLCHIFRDSEAEKFYLIDMARAFKPKLLKSRYQIKDIAQLYYSAPGKYFSSKDRLRFYLEYIGKSGLNKKDKKFIKTVLKKVKRMARHDLKHRRSVPFMN